MARFGLFGLMDHSTFLALFGGLTVLYAAAWIAIERLIPPPL
jgi:hypothetical protein